MTLHWDSLLAVVAASLGSAVTVVALVALALVGLSARTPRLVRPGVPARRPPLTPRTGAALAATCLSIAAAIVLLGLQAIVVR
jgi:hypothetical protein